MSLLNMAQPQPVQQVPPPKQGGLLMPPGQGQPPMPQQRPPMPGQPQKDPLREKLARALMSDPSPGNMKKIVEFLMKIQHPKAQEVAQLFQSVMGDPQKTQQLIQQIQQNL